MKTSLNVTANSRTLKVRLRCTIEATDLTRYEIMRMKGKLADKVSDALRDLPYGSISVLDISAK